MSIPWNLIERDVRVIDADLLEEAQVVVILALQPGGTDARAEADLGLPLAVRRVDMGRPRRVKRAEGDRAEG